MHLHSDAVAALAAANAAIAAVTPADRRALLARFYLLDALSPARVLRGRDIEPALQKELAHCLSVGLLKATTDDACYLDIAELQQRLRVRRRAETGALLLAPMAMVMLSVGVMALLR